MHEPIQQHAASQSEIAGDAIRYRAAILEKPHLAQFLSDALMESGLFASSFENAAELLAALPKYAPHLVVLGTLGHGVDSVRVIEELSRGRYQGAVLVVGPAVAPLTKAVQNLGSELGLRMLPLMATPFGQDALRSLVAALEPCSGPTKPAVDLHEALACNWLELWYQPKMELRSFTLQGAEALLRVRHPVMGILGADQVIPGASEQELFDISTYVISRAMADWQWFFDNHGHLEMAINLPLAYLNKPHLLASLVGRIPTEPTFDGVVVETNASELLGHLDTARNVSKTFRPLKVALSVDDLGAEWPDLLASAYDFPFAEIKVDRSLVSGCCDSSKKRSTCRRIIELADAVGARTVAEGVQTRADFVTVRDLGFDIVQGFFVAKPMSRARFLSRILRRPLTLSGMHC